MSILSMWREARGGVMRKALLDAMGHLNNLNPEAQFACMDYFADNYDNVKSYYASASETERKAYLRQTKRDISAMWDRGERAKAIAVSILMLSAESQSVPGDDARFVKAATTTLIADLRKRLPNPGDA